MHQKLKATPGIFLVGFMGCGKSTVGGLLASELGWDFVDLDAAIEKTAGRTVPRIFEEDGEPVFRALERAELEKQIQAIRSGRARVLSLGGGAFVQPDNRGRLADCGLSLWLEAPVDCLWERVSSNPEERPLARDRQTFYKLYSERERLYALADYRIVADGAPEATVATILGLKLI